MAATLVANIQEPAVWGQYLTEESIYKSAMIKSGIMQVNTKIKTFLDGGGRTFTVPFYQRPGNALQTYLTDTTITVNNITTGNTLARMFGFTQGFGAEDLASKIAGDNVTDAIQAMLDDYWNRQMQNVLNDVVTGVIADNVANDSGDMVNDITTTGSVTSAHKISSSAVINTYKIKGDAANYTAIAMDSIPYYNLVDQNLIDFRPDNEQNIGFGTYLGLTVIVDDNLNKPIVTNQQYWCVLYEAGAIQFGETSVNTIPFELNRAASTSTDEIFTRRVFTMAPKGISWVEGSVASTNPTQAEIVVAANWDRKFNLKNTGFTILKVNG